MLYLPTCVGLRYGHLHSTLEVISRQCGLNHFTQNVLVITHQNLTKIRIYLTFIPQGLNRDNHHPDGLPSCVAPLLLQMVRGC